ncbi:MAG: right-handed parallel beta-helix repeat-containing protein, partial [Promethearchaeota archaeon]
GIFIRDSNVFAEINNCNIYNSGVMIDDAGIRLHNCSNIKIVYTNSHNNGFSGISIKSGSLNISLQSNDVIDNKGYGIFLDGTNDTNIENNNIISNGYRGINLFESHRNILQNNSILDNYIDGIHITSGNENVVYGNSIKNNTGVGIYLEGCSDCIISENDLHYNIIGQIKDVNGKNNLIYDNDEIISTQQRNLNIFGVITTIVGVISFSIILVIKIKRRSTSKQTELGAT